MLNLTQHVASEEQVSSGVVEPRDKEAVRRLLTFDRLPDEAEVLARAKSLVDICLAEEGEVIMIGGALWLMAPLERGLFAAGLVPVYAFTRREVVEVGGVKKSVFRHAGFVPAVRKDSAY